jgi:hypothetical protein
MKMQGTCKPDSWKSRESKQQPRYVDWRELNYDQSITMSFLTGRLISKTDVNG